MKAILDMPRLGVQNSCPFCSEILGCSVFSIAIQEYLERCFVFEGMYNIRIIADRAPVDLMHVLLMTSEHISSFRMSSEEVHFQLDCSVRSLAQKIKSSVVFFEHGVERESCLNCMQLSSCQDHAHLHFLPSSSEKVELQKINIFLENDSRFEFGYSCYSLTDVYSYLQLMGSDTEYVLLGSYSIRTGKLNVMVYFSEVVPSQLIKGLLSIDRHGSPTAFDGKQRVQKVRDTVKKMLEVSTPLLQSEFSRKNEKE